MKHFYFKSIFLSLLMMVTGMNVASAADTWVKTAPADLKTGDVVVIVDLKSSCAMSNDKGTNNAPSAVEVSLNDTKSEITSDVDVTLQWTVAKSDEGYQFFAPTETWLYCRDNNDGLRVGTNVSNKLFSIKTVNVNNIDKIYLYNINQGRYIGVYNNQDWRSYTTSPNNSQSNIKTTQTAFFKKESGDAVLSSISISGYTTTFNVGDTFVFGGTVMANYENGDPKDVTSFATISGYNMNTPGTQTVTVSYGGKTATYEITVNTVPVTGITLATNEEEIEVGQTLQLTATIQPENATNKEYSWSSSDEDVATVDENGLVSAIAAGLATITVTTTDGGKTATCAVKVKAKEGIWYSLVTSTDNLAQDDKVIIVNTENKRAMSTTQNENNRQATVVTIASGKAFVPKNGDVQVLTLEGNNTDGWYFYTGSGYLYAASSSNNQLKTEAGKDKNNNAKAAITISKGATSVVFQGDHTRNVLQNNGQIFSCYASASQAPVDIYKLDDEKQDAELSFSEETVTVNVAEIDAFVSPTFNNPNNLIITAASTNEDVAVFDVGTSEIVLNGSVGTAEITVTSSATDEYRAGVASITVMVKKADTAVSFKEAVVEITFGDNYNKQEAKTEGVSGNLEYRSSDESVVNFHGNSVIDILKPGTVTITATAPATDTTEESSATYTLKIYEPADAVVGTALALDEHFDDCESTRPDATITDNKGWNGTNQFKALPDREKNIWTVDGTASPAGNGCLKLGTSTNAGDATSPSFTLNGTAPLTFDIAPWTSSSDGSITGAKSVTITLTNAKFEDDSTTKTVGGVEGQPFQTTFEIGWNHFEYNIRGSGEGDVAINFHGSSQFFLDNVVVGGGAQPAHEIKLTFSSAGYLTWVATADIDFEATADVTAYQITEATPQGITAEEVKKAPKGAALLLNGTGTVELKRTSGVSPLTNNKMLACTDASVTGITGSATSTDIYVLGNGSKGLGFYMLKNTLQAGKGYLSISGGASAKATFIGFEETTGICNVSETSEEEGVCYNLQGVRVMNPQKGIYIKNGKKIVVK